MQRRLPLRGALALLALAGTLPALLLWRSVQSFLLPSQGPGQQEGGAATDSIEVQPETEAYQLPQLGYAYDALEPSIDRATMEIHHSKHHATYVAGLNKAFEGEESPPLLDLVRGAIRSERPAQRNAGGGVWNHNFFWLEMAPAGTGGKPSAKLTKAIGEAFGSLEGLKEIVSTGASPAALFGSGWAWIIVNKAGKLEFTTTPNQDNPLMEGVQAAEQGSSPPPPPSLQMGASGPESSASSSSSKAEKKAKAKKVQKKGKEKKKKDAKKKKKEKGEKRKAVASSSSESAGKRKRAKEKKSKGDSKEEAQERWIFGREKALRKADPQLSKEEALRRAVEEYCTLYNVMEPREGGEAAAPAQASPKPAVSNEHITDDRVRDAVEQAVKEAKETAREAGKTEEEVEAEAAKAREAVLVVAEQNGLYTPPPPPKQMSLFLQEKDRELDEYVRKGMPSTDDRPRSETHQGQGRGSLDVTKIRLFSSV